MKNLFLGSLAFAATIAGPAMAADLPYKAPPPLPVAYYDWSGAYAGFNIGGARYDVTHHFPTPGATTPDVTTGNRDGIFGFHAGAQLQWGAWVLGAEAARIACFNECSSTSDVLPVNLGFDENTFGQHKITNLVMAGARPGCGWGRRRVFFPGGWGGGDTQKNKYSAHTASSRCMWSWK